MSGTAVEALRESLTCGICLEVMTDPMTVCSQGHVYDLECVSDWKKQKNSCPTCREPLLATWTRSKFVVRYLEQYHRLDKTALPILEQSTMLPDLPTGLLSTAFKTNDLIAARQAIGQNAKIQYADVVDNVSSREMFALLTAHYSQSRTGLLQMAVKHNKLESLTMLWTLDPPFRFNPDDFTILHYACQHENSVSLHFLLNYCPPDGHLPPRHYINACDAAGRTPLMIACTHDTSLACVRLLLDHGADRSIRTPSGLTALSYARVRDKQPLISMLTQPPPEETCILQ